MEKGWHGHSQSPNAREDQHQSQSETYKNNKGIAKVGKDYKK